MLFGKLERIRLQRRITNHSLVNRTMERHVLRSTISRIVVRTALEVRSMHNVRKGVLGHVGVSRWTLSYVARRTSLVVTATRAEPRRANRAKASRR